MNDYKDRISIGYFEGSNYYGILIDGKQIHTTTNKIEADLFVGELLLRMGQNLPESENSSPDGNLCFVCKKEIEAMNKKREFEVLEYKLECPYFQDVMVGDGKCTICNFNSGSIICQGKAIRLCNYKYKNRL